MRSALSAALAFGLCVFTFSASTAAHPHRDRAGRQDQNPELTTFRGNEARDAERELASKQEFLKLQGSWNCVRWEEGGKPLGAEELKGRTAFFGGEICLIRQDGKVTQIITQKLDPTRTLKTVTATVNQGRFKGEVLLGIYELKGDTLTVCFDTDGQKRPDKFETLEDGHQILAVYERRPPVRTEEISLAGRYKSLSLQMDGSEHRADAVIQRRGDAWIVSYMKGNAVTYVGVGIRKGDLLSVCWANRGQAGISVYRIEDGPNLVGHYTELGGIGYLSREILTFDERAD